MKGLAVVDSAGCLMSLSLWERNRKRLLKKDVLSFYLVIVIIITNSYNTGK